MNKNPYHFNEFFIDEEIWNRQFGKLQVHGLLDLIRVLSELRMRRLMKLCLVSYENAETPGLLTYHIWLYSKLTRYTCAALSGLRLDLIQMNMLLLIFVLSRLKTLTRPGVEEGTSHILHGADCGSSGGLLAAGVRQLLAHFKNEITRLNAVKALICIFPVSHLSPLHLLRHHACNIILLELYRHKECVEEWCGRVSKQAVSDVTRCFSTQAEGSICLEDHHL